MTIYHLQLRVSFAHALPEDTDEAFGDLTTRVMDALCDLEEVDDGIIDPDIGANSTAACSTCR